MDTWDKSTGDFPSGVPGRPFKPSHMSSSHDACHFVPSSLTEHCCMFSVCCLRNSLLHQLTWLKGSYITCHTSHQSVVLYRTFHRSLSLLCTVTVPVKKKKKNLHSSVRTANDIGIKCFMRWYMLVTSLSILLCQLNPLSTDEDIIFFLLPVQRQQSAFVSISFR